MSQLSGKDLDIAVGLANGWAIQADELNSERWILPDGSAGMLVDVYRPSSYWPHCEALLMLMDDETKERWAAAGTFDKRDFPRACHLYLDMKEDRRKIELEIEMPPIPEIPSLWAYVIPQSFLSALYIWCTRYARHAVRVDRVRRALK